MKEKSPPTLRVVLADDHKVFLEAFACELESRSRFRVVGTATTAEGAIATVKSEKPDLFLINLYLPSLQDGMELIKWARRSANTLGFKFGVLTGHDSEHAFLAAVGSGCRPELFLLKQWSIQTILSKLITKNPQVEGKFAAALVGPFRNNDYESNRYGLTEMELTVLSYIGMGLLDKQIAVSLNRNPRTIARYIRVAKMKLETDTRIQAVLKAYDEGLINCRDNGNAPSGTIPIKTGSTGNRKLSLVSHS